MSRVIVFEVDRGNGPERVSFRSAVPVTIGRGPTNQLVIADGRISTRHGEVRFRDGAFHYRDLRSTNGSMRARGDERVVVDGDSTAEVPLEGGDRLLLGDVDDPIVLRVSITVEEVAPEGTIVARRKVDSATELSDVLLQTRGAGFAALSALLRRIGGETEAAEVFEHVAGFLLDLLPAAQSVVLVLRDPTAPALRLTRAERTVTEVAEDPPPWPRGLVSEAMETSEAVLSNELGGDAEQSLARFGAGGALAVPLVGTNAPKLGVLVIASEEAGFAPRDLDLSLALSHQVANAFATARLVRRLRAVERRLRDENRYLKAEVRRNDVFQDIIGDSPAIRAVFEQMRLVNTLCALPPFSAPLSTGS